ncbi:MAG: carbohydrate kinase family protein [bacterium]|jgi:sugar/nucleoside kinase (ribokinase family)|nr:carbohydrate kinase family protein [bacterium]
MYDVITIGAGVRDVFLVSDQFIALKSPRFSTGVGECVALGSKIELEEIVLTTGGGATNAAATFGSLGFKTAAMCKVGNDSPGRDVKEDLETFGVDTKLIKTVKGETGYSTLLTMKDGERTVLVYRGVSGTFSPRDIDTKQFKKTKWVYLTSLGGNTALSKRIINAAHKAGANVMWNPGSKELKAGMSFFKPLLPKITVLNMNKEEGQMLTGKKKIKEMMQVLHTDGMTRLITDGTKGSYAYKDGELVHAGTTSAEAISRTGAGDAFGSGFLSGLMKTDKLESALQIGTLNAESVIQKHGAKNGILTRWPSKKALRVITCS